MTEKRTKSIRIRVTPEEHELFSEKSGDLSISEWIRGLATGATALKKRRIPKIDPAALRQLAGIGNNLNQIARIVNQRKMKVEARWLITELIGLETAVRDLTEELKNGSRLS